MSVTLTVLGALTVKRALQMIGRDGRATSDRAWRLIATYGRYYVVAHEAFNEMQTAAFTSFSQIAEHAASAIDPAARPV